MVHIRFAPASVDDAVTAELLFTAIGGDRSRLTAVCEDYRHNRSTELLAALVDDDLAGVAGYTAHSGRITLRHIATAEPHRRTGIGRRLIAEIRSRSPRLDLVAETGAASLDFYLATGFTATSLGEKYPGVERFQVYLKARLCPADHG